MNTHTHEQMSCCHEAKTDERQYATDPVCGMEVAVDDAALHYVHEGKDYYFCSNHCLKSFSKNAGSYLHQAEDIKTSPWSGIKPVHMGLTGTMILLIVFFGVVFLANGSIEAALREFTRLWYWILFLAGGFGFQLGLFFHIKKSVKAKMTGATTEVAASGTISTGSMVACCAHGLVNLLPIVGLSVAAAFLAKYQHPFILLGVFSNLVGITIMLGIAKKNNVLPQNHVGHLIQHANLRTVRYTTVIVGVLAVLGSSFWSYIN